MKHIILIAVLFSIANCDKAPEAPKAEMSATVEAKKVEGESIALNAEKSVVKWIGTKLKGKHNGTIKISEGNLIVNAGKIVGGNFTIDMATLVSEDLKKDLESKGKLEGHLKSEDFFDVAKFPKSTFVLNSVSENADGTTTISGNLTMKGISKGISFPAKVQLNAAKKPVSATANFNIDRKLWGIVYPGQPDNLIRDEINLDLNLTTL
jgi:polyisoprenoid-binding protein YceI